MIALQFLEVLRNLTSVNACMFGFSTVYASIYARAFNDAFEDLETDSFYDRLLRAIDKELTKELKSNKFKFLLSKYIESLTDLQQVLRSIGYPADYLHISFDALARIWSYWITFQQELDLTRSETLALNGDTRLIHYHNGSNADSKPLLMIYAPINRFHVMDLTPKFSLVRNLLSNGIDVYLLDWGYPSYPDAGSLDDYVMCVDKAMKVIKSKTGNEKVSILGYCWGGIIALMYAALKKENVARLVLMATPVDFTKDNTIPSTWLKTINADKIVDAFGHVDGYIVDAAFFMRNPPRFSFDKYLRMFGRIYDRDFLNTFAAVERWLYNSPPIPGNLFRQIVNDCYKDNLLIYNKMQINGERIDLGRIDFPLLTIIAENDDIVSPEAAVPVNDYVSSKEKKCLKLKGGHVKLCVSPEAHRTLWPEVAKWLLSN